MPELARLLQNGAKRVEPMSRKLKTSALAMVCLLCVLMVFYSHRLTGTAGVPLEHTPFLDIGRTIQSWSSSDSDSDFSLSGSANLPGDIRNAIAEQRRMIAEEMKDYHYPAGKYNVTAKSLSDLVPELGGSPMRSVIITSWRSGSTFLGDVLNSHPGNFYHYEPLLDYDIVQVRGEPLARGAVQNLRNLLSCNYTSLHHYLDYGKDHVWLFTHNTRLWEQCLKHPHLCWLPEFLNPFCKLFPFQSMKVVRLRLRLMEDLLEDPSLNLRVLLLVRDPRGTLQSRKHREWCPGNADCIDASRLCTDLVSDYSAAIKFASKYPQRFRAVRYEDLSIEPYEGVKDLFKFFGLDFHPNVQLFLDTHTKIDVGGVSSTYRNSKSAPFHWRQDLTHYEVRAIQRVCRPAMKYWGYIQAMNRSHQREFNPLGEFTLE